MRTTVNVLAFQAAWLACVGAAAHGAPGWGLCAIGAAVMLHFVLSETVTADALLLAAAVGIGAVWDTLAVRLGWIEYASPGPWPEFAPSWILALWALFATTLRETLRWMHTRPVLAVLFGGIGGPLSYAAAARLGACRFGDPIVSLVALAIGWATITPLLVEAARRLDKRALSA